MLSDNLVLEKLLNTKGNKKIKNCNIVILLQSTTLFQFDLKENTDFVTINIYQKQKRKSDDGTGNSFYCISM